MFFGLSLGHGNRRASHRAGSVAAEQPTERVIATATLAPPLDGNGLWRSLVSALDWGSRGREFESPQPDEVPRA